MDTLEDAITTIVTKQDETNNLIKEFKESKYQDMKGIIQKI